MKKLLTLTLALALLLTGCGVPSAPAETPEATTVSTVVRTEVVYPLPAPAELVGLARVGDTLIVAGDDGGAPVLGMADWSLDGAPALGETRLLDAGEAAICGVAAGEDGFFVLTAALTVCEYAADGAFLREITLQDFPAERAEGLAVFDGGFVVYAGNYYALTDRDGALISHGAMPDGCLVESVSPTAAGPVLAWQDIPAAAGHFVRLPDGAELEAAGADPLGVGLGSWTVAQGLDGEYLANDGADFFELRFGESCEPVFHWTEAQIAPGNCTYLCRLGETAYAYTVAGSDGLRLAHLAERVQGGRSTVRVALLGTGGLQSRFEQLNAADGEYYYDCELYKATDLPRLRAELSGANSPDLVVFTHQLFSDETDDLVLDTSSKYFEDLYPYLDADAELGRESFLPGLLPALERHGELHELWSKVEINTVAMRASDAAGRRRWSAAELGTLFAARDYEFALAPDGVAMTRENLLHFLAVLSAEAFTDRAAASCRFDDGDFAALLEWAGAFGNDGMPTELPAASEVMLVPQLLQNARVVQSQFTRYGEPLVYVGYPVGEGGGHYYLSYGACYAIPAHSANKSGAWEAVRSALTLSAQLAGLEDVYAPFPVLYDAFERQTARWLDETQTAALDALLRDTTAAQSYADAPLYDIIYAGGQSYLSGDKTAEEAAALIQSRASVYMAEKYGK